MPRKKIRQPTFRCATVADRWGENLFWDEMIDVSWRYDDLDTVSFYLPVVEGKEPLIQRGNVLLLTNGSADRLVRVIAVEPPTSGKMYIEARGYEDILGVRPPP